MNNGVLALILILVAIIIIVALIFYYCPSVWGAFYNWCNFDQFWPYGELYRDNNIENNSAFLLSVDRIFTHLPEHIFTVGKINNVIVLDSPPGFKVKRSGVYTVRLNMSVSSLEENLDIDVAIFRDDDIQMNTVISTTLTKEINTITSLGKVKCQIGDVIRVKLRTREVDSQMIIRYINFCLN